MYSKWIKKLLICVAAVLLLSVLTAWQTIQRKQMLVGAKLVTPTQWEQLQQGYTPGAFTPELLLWEGEPVAYDSAANTVYLPQSLQSKQWEGSLSAQPGTALYLLQDESLGDKAGCIQENRSFQLAVICGGVYCQTQVVFTGMPAVCIWGNGDDTLSRFLLIDPEHTQNRTKTTATHCTFHIRGNSSAAAQDPGYRLELCDGDGNRIKKNLLGIRDDDDWILNGFVYDPLMLREKMAYHLWEKVNALEETPVYSSSVTYVELFINDEYRGLYGLMPRLDDKQMKLSEQDVVYKIRDYVYPSPDDYAAANGTTEVSKGAITMEFPDAGGSWEPMWAYHAFIGGVTEPMEQLNGRIPASNSVASHLFLGLTQAEDNRWKNKILIVKKEKNGVAFYQTVWDLDLTFGNPYIPLFDPNKADYDMGIPYPYGSIIDDYVMSAMKNQDAERMHHLSVQKWNSWRAAGITADYLCDYAREQLDTLLHTGAMWRTAQRRASVEYVTQIDQLENWIRVQFAQVDAYYGIEENTP